MMGWVKGTFRVPEFKRRSCDRMVFFVILSVVMPCVGARRI